MKKALITGITGQDGSYLAEFLINKGYEVHGIIRRGSCFNTWRIDHLYRELQQDNPDDYVIATGKTHSVREFAEEACKILEIDLEWKGQGTDEKGINKKTGKVIIGIDPRYFRPTEVESLCGDPSKAEKVLGWKAKTTFKELVKIMVNADVHILKSKEAIY